MRNNNILDTPDSTSPSKIEKDTAISFGWMKEGHYNRFLYRDVELKKREKPNLYIKKNEQPILWNLMEVIEQLDLHIEGVKYIILRLWFENVEDRFNIKFYANNSTDSEKSAGDISIFNLSPEEVVELVKLKIAIVQQ